MEAEAEVRFSTLKERDENEATEETEAVEKEVDDGVKEGEAAARDAAVDAAAAAAAATKEAIRAKYGTWGVRVAETFGEDSWVVKQTVASDNGCCKACLIIGCLLTGCYCCCCFFCFCFGGCCCGGCCGACKKSEDENQGIVKKEPVTTEPQKEYGAADP
ncbi:dnaJ homolog subfamily C member 5-like [Oscarella lobularis]|uniref:dnaJ homolog subfamily C member 5-like n=1 Tax=Oscarella lobularis TaxID=121494 RepID=UPI0033135B8C